MEMEKLKNKYLENFEKASGEIENWPEWKKEWVAAVIGRPLSRKKIYNEREFTISEEEFKI